MISPAGRTQICKRLAAQHNKTMVQVQRNVQNTLMSVLWHLIRQSAVESLPEGEEVPDVPPAVLIPVSELQEVPANFGLTLQSGEDEAGNKTVSVIAVLVKPKSNIILPGG